MRITANEFNHLFPVGTPVAYWPVLPPPEGDPYEAWRSSRTRSKAWDLADGRPVVAIEGVAGGVSLLHLELECDDDDEEPRGPTGEQLPCCPVCEQGLYLRIEDERCWVTWVCGCSASASEGPWTTAEWLARVERFDPQEPRRNVVPFGKQLDLVE